MTTRKPTTTIQPSKTASRPSSHEGHRPAEVAEVVREAMGPGMQFGVPVDRIVKAIDRP